MYMPTSGGYLLSGIYVGTFVAYVDVKPSPNTESSADIDTETADESDNKFDLDTSLDTQEKRHLEIGVSNNNETHCSSKRMKSS